LFFESSLAASARVDLGFDNGNRTAELVKGRRGLVACLGDPVFQYVDSKFGEQLFALVFVNIHSCSYRWANGEVRDYEVTFGTVNRRRGSMCKHGRIAPPMGHGAPNCGLPVAIDNGFVGHFRFGFFKSIG